MVIGRDDTEAAALVAGLSRWRSAGLRCGQLHGRAGPAGPGSTDVTDGNWHHIVAVHDDSANALYLYVDGNQTPHGTDSIDFPGDFASAGAEVNLGCIDLSHGYNFDGDIDEVAVYARALTPTEVEEHHQSGKVSARLL